MEDSIKLLQKYKDDIDKKKRELDKATGRKDAMLLRLQKDFDISDIGGARKKLEELKKERAKLMADFEERMESLREDYEL